MNDAASLVRNKRMRPLPRKCELRIFFRCSKCEFYHCCFLVNLDYWCMMAGVTYDDRTKFSFMLENWVVFAQQLWKVIKHKLHHVFMETVKASSFRYDTNIKHPKSLLVSTPLVFVVTLLLLHWPDSVHPDNTRGDTGSDYASTGFVKKLQQRFHCSFFVEIFDSLKPGRKRILSDNVRQFVSS